MMINRKQYNSALEEIKRNPEQFEAVLEEGHCVVLAGPGSGKTKTLTIAMARAIIDEVEEPRGIACITYNNECAIELEERLAELGIISSENIFIGTIHSFALTQVILPYARCALPDLGTHIAVASKDECKNAVELAYQRIGGGRDNPHKRWRFAEEKRRKHVNRDAPEWIGQNVELANFVEEYEKVLHEQGLIDFDDMPLLALRIIKKAPWVGQALLAKFPTLFVDEYQDLGHALHELVLRLCFGTGIRLFAVGDADQSMYGFLGANPSLLNELIVRPDVNDIRLRFNYRCGQKIIDASMAVLGEERNYETSDGKREGVVDFHVVDGGLELQAQYIFEEILPQIQQSIPMEEVAILYRWAKHGDFITSQARARGIPIIQADANALVKRGSRLSRFVEACARWSGGGWQFVNPSFQKLAYDASTFVYGVDATDEEKWQIQSELISFLKETADQDLTTHQWISRFKREVLVLWRERARNTLENWTDIDEMLVRTDPSKVGTEDLPLKHFAGFVEGTGRLNLSTLHSAKGREFEVVILFGMDGDTIPNYYERQSDKEIQVARRQFYVGVTRAKSVLKVIVNSGSVSPFVIELVKRLHSEGTEEEA